MTIPTYRDLVARRDDLNPHWMWTLTWEPYNHLDGEKEFATENEARNFAENELADLDPDAHHITLENSVGTRRYEWDIDD
jgi:hypothetical protein